MTLQRFALLGLVTAAIAVPAVSSADGTREIRQTGRAAGETVREAPAEVRERLTGDSQRSATREQPSELLRNTVQLNDEISYPLDTGCTYRATVRGTVSPVRYNRRDSAEIQRLRPDLRVAATVSCPGSTESHIQERRVSSTGVTREEFERLLNLNASVERMQNSGRCMYMPDLSFDNQSVVARSVDYLCPRARGGGPDR